MSKEIKRRHYSVGPIILMLTVGSIFTAIGIALVVIMISSLIKVNFIGIDAFIIVPFILIIALLGFGGVALYMGGKEVYLWIREHRTKRRGNDATAIITDYKCASFSKGGNTNKRWALILSYKDGGENKTFTTDYLFEINEFKYLRKLPKIKIKIDGDFVAVTEPFTEDIYKLDSRYGIEKAFFKQKPVAILLRLWMVFFFIALAFLIISMVIGNSVCMQIAIPVIFAVHFPFVIPLAILLIKWFSRKK